MSTMQKTTVRRSGRAIGGGSLWLVIRFTPPGSGARQGEQVIGTVKRISVGWIAQRAGGAFTFHDDRAGAVAAARGW